MISVTPALLRGLGGDGPTQANAVPHSEKAGFSAERDERLFHGGSGRHHVDQPGAHAILTNSGFSVGIGPLPPIPLPFAGGR